MRFVLVLGREASARKVAPPVSSKAKARLKINTAAMAISVAQRRKRLFSRGAGAVRRESMAGLPVTELAVAGLAMTGLAVTWLIGAHRCSLRD